MQNDRAITMNYEFYILHYFYVANFHPIGKITPKINWKNA